VSIDLVSFIVPLGAILAAAILVLALVRRRR
jgi:uncharacterized protein (TIGR03382 family)